MPHWISRRPYGLVSLALCGATIAVMRDWCSDSPVVPFVASLRVEEARATFVLSSLSASAFGALAYLRDPARGGGAIGLVLGLLLMGMASPSVVDAMARSDRARMACTQRQIATLRGLARYRLQHRPSAEADGHVSMRQAIAAGYVRAELDRLGVPWAQNERPFDGRFCVEQMRRTGIYCKEHHWFTPYDGSPCMVVRRPEDLPP